MMSRPFLAVTLILSLLVACGGDRKEAVGEQSGSNITTATATADAAAAKPTVAPTPQPGDVRVANEPFSVETPDGIVLHGHIYSPDGPKRQALIIVATVDQSTWAESTATLTSEGIAVFTFDPRGFGENGVSEAPSTLPADSSLVTRFVMSREYPLVYLLGVGEQGGAAVSEATDSLDGVTGVLTYGYADASDTPYGLQIAPEKTWSGEDVLADETVRDIVLTFVLGAN